MNRKEKKQSPTISLIAAMANNRVIGKDNQMPWHLPADLKHFKAVTLGKPVVMGRKTFESIGRPLPGRRNLVISRQTDLQLDGVDVFHSIEDALADLAGIEEVMIIGGGRLYQQMISFADKLYITWIQTEIEGDTKFPAFDESDYKVLDRSHYKADEKNVFDLEFVEYQRI